MKPNLKLVKLMKYGVIFFALPGKLLWNNQFSFDGKNCFLFSAISIIFYFNSFIAFFVISSRFFFLSLAENLAGR
jgi:hypothetical protein